MADLRAAAQQALSWIHYMRREYGMDEPREERDLRAALAQAEQDVDLPALCSAIAKRLGESWLVVGPDGSRFVAQTPFRAASAANKHFGRLHYDPKQAAEFVEMIDKIRRDSERDNDRLITMHGSLNCPTCGGSGHIGDAEPDAYGYASRLAVAIWEKHYKDAAPEWKPLNDLMGVLTQIDNMTSDLTRRQAEPVAWMRPDNRVAEESYSRTQFIRGADKPPIGTWVPLYTALAQAAPVAESCAWHQDGDTESSLYATSCHNYFDLTDGTPADNDMRWCCYCGKTLVQELIEEDGNG